MSTLPAPRNTTLATTSPIPQQVHLEPVSPAFAPIVQTETRGAIVAAPMSFTGSGQRIWRMVPLALPLPLRIALLTFAVLVIGIVWTFVLAWYMTFGLLVVPYRLIRRGQRKRNVEARRHAELLAAVQIGAKR